MTCNVYELLTRSRSGSEELSVIKAVKRTGIIIFCKDTLFYREQELMGRFTRYKQQSSILLSWVGLSQPRVN